MIPVYADDINNGLQGFDVPMGLMEYNKTIGTSVGITISANGSKLSRLAIYGDVSSQKYNVTKQEYWSGKNVGSWSTTVKTPKSTSIEVKYK